MKKTGIILAAGFGSRLAGTDDDTDLKPLTNVNGIPLIYRTIRSLKIAGCSRVVIVLGYGFEQIKEDILESYTGDLPIEFARNEQYDLSNGISVLAAEPFVEGNFILTMADHILSDEMMLLAKEHVPPENGATLLVDFKLDEIFDMDDATKVDSQNGRIHSIGKEITDFNCVDTGVFVCTPSLLNEIKKVFKKQGDASLSDGIQALANKNKMHTLDIGNAFWQDVDTPEMLEHAEKILNTEIPAEV
ncbi:NTP transferase domain-containing protein [Rhodohalobacter sulfatireducens]|uniref:NTP transferase domain-containing protein n=1 Tax=Rhodohalobacter sulfatireducens TaxID=2911366 RepID=A0ABS9KI33_9BACT|nr:NTP transferase domain-containing protein [Rhodohalobacter sulfatireducens]MCG2590507.1 NTP transferase domain-containing protein [Rhodohalobacter sulfatireducens]MDR9410624.1 NTP transferase domain-containing protein [Balneolaceae bacterium]